MRNRRELWDGEKAEGYDYDVVLAVNRKAFVVAVEQHEVSEEAECEGRHEVGEDSKSETHFHFRFPFPCFVLAFAFGVSVWT